MTMRNMGHSGGGGGEEAGEAAMVITDVGRDKGRWDWGFLAQISKLSRAQNWTDIFADKELADALTNPLTLCIQWDCLRVQSAYRFWDQYHYITTNVKMKGICYILHSSRIVQNSRISTIGCAWKLYYCHFYPPPSTLATSGERRHLRHAPATVEYPSLTNGRSVEFPLLFLRLRRIHWRRRSSLSWLRRETRWGTRRGLGIANSGFRSDLDKWTGRRKVERNKDTCYLQGPFFFTRKNQSIDHLYSPNKGLAVKRSNPRVH